MSDLGVTAAESSVVAEPLIVRTAADEGPPLTPGGDRSPSAHSSHWRRAARRLTREPVAIAALGFLILVGLMAIFAPLVAPHDPNELFPETFADPSGDHWLGTDNLGRDTFSRLVFGARASLQTTLLVALFGVLIAVPIGLLAGYKSGSTDNVVMRFTDALLSIPPLVLALAVAGILGPGATQRRDRPDDRRHPRARPAGAGAGAGGPRGRLRRGLQGDRHRVHRDRTAPRPAACAVAAHRAGLGHARSDPGHRGLAELSRPRCAAAQPLVGQDAQGRLRRDGHRRPTDAGAGDRHRLDDAGVQRPR